MELPFVKGGLRSVNSFMSRSFCRHYQNIRDKSLAWSDNHPSSKWVRPICDLQDKLPSPKSINVVYLWLSHVLREHALLFSIFSSNNTRLANTYQYPKLFLFICSRTLMEFIIQSLKNTPGRIIATLCTQSLKVTNKLNNSHSDWWSWCSFKVVISFLNILMY